MVRGLRGTRLAEPVSKTGRRGRGAARYGDGVRDRVGGCIDHRNRPDPRLATNTEGPRWASQRPSQWALAESERKRLKSSSQALQQLIQGLGFQMRSRLLCREVGLSQKDGNRYTLPSLLEILGSLISRASYCSFQNTKGTIHKLLASGSERNHQVAQNPPRADHGPSGDLVED